MAIQENDILSGRPLIMSFPDKFTFDDDGTVASSDKYTIDAENDGETAKVVLKTVEDVLIATLYSYDIDTDTTTINIATYTLPNDFGIVNDIDAEVDAYQYITAIMGTPIASDTLDMSTYGQAAKVATNYMTWSAQYGLVISEDATEDPGDMQGGNTRITSDGMDVYKGQNRVAHFGEEVILGDEEGANAYLDPDTFKITNADGVDFFSVDMDGTPIQTYRWIGGDLVVVSPGEASISISDLAFSDVVPDGNEVLVDSALHVGNTVNRPQWTVIKGTPKTEQVTVPLGITLTLVYDGNHNYTVTFTAPSVTTRYRLGLKGFLYVDAPSFAFGTRENGTGGAFSVAMGEGVTADEDNQIALGKYNEGDSDNLLEIGYGTSNTPKNVFAIEKTGKLSSLALDCGQITGINAPAGDTTSAQWVSFNHTFPSTPIVVASFYSNPSGTPLNDFGRCGVSVFDVTQYGFYFRVYNNGTVARSPYVNWIAMLA